MSTSRLYYNPRCSKCRTALDLLKARGVEPDVVEYLEAPPTAAGLREILTALGVGPRSLLRTDEPEYSSLALDRDGLGDDELIDAMSANPRLIQRPIFVHGERAVIGRPAERVLDLLD
ncbi:arsenate reductase (glutaredoxin) [Lysobacter korlensis]|uniref:Arsenate reductase n=1 Tax=Lysobacter korlensis TaxID=553636 RepID=A0ABV6RL66_9GAMM